MTAQSQPEQPESLQMAIRSMIQEAARLRTRIAQLEAENQQLKAAFADADPVSGQCRFANEKKWGWCAVEHVRMVQADPRYAADGYEVRYLYAHPAASRPALSDEEIFEAAKRTLPGKAHALIHETNADYAHMCDMEPGTRWICQEVRPEHSLSFAREIERLANGIGDPT
ncbi:hypothetical protein [Diaphorobacter caeni]|uniref:hypothetical protein n=1 Tax=Diaphorobacter caeni TaxID=2784387 RepID=UPI00188F2290|nr:hypothetical protein [Diaphorobacter caeni]MBF5007638.1 hypothetical protein [Diaphorobacter caeni]